MEEKILVKSQISKRTSDIILFLAIAGFFAGLLMVLCYAIIESSSEEGKMNLIGILISAIVCISIAVILMLLFLVIKCSELIITEHNVRCKFNLGWFSWENIFPITKVTAFIRIRFFHVVVITTPSGICSLILLENYKEIVDTLSERINETQLSKAL